jgi:hypothetical protein
MAKPKHPAAGTDSSLATIGAPQQTTWRMHAHTGFRLPHLCLPRPGIDLQKWAVIACDQYTAEPEYWQRVAQQVGDAPSTLSLIFPEAYLGAADAPQRIARIQATMRRYLAEGLLVDHDGAVLVERRIGPHTRRGLMLELDLEHYDFSPSSTSLIRPTEGTIVERLAPRIEVRRDAELELPHILVLIDDPQHTVVEPVAAERAAMRALYDTALMGGGGHVSGHALTAEQGERVVRALQALADPQAFCARYAVPAGTPPMLFAVGDGNHSLATAKSIWEQAKATVGLQHPSRWALVEVVNIHDPALAFEPIHRLLFGVRGDLRQALADTYGARCVDLPSGEALRQRLKQPMAAQAFGLIGPGARFAVVEIDAPPSSLAVGTVQAFVDRFIADGGAAQVDYVHGDDVLERLALQSGHAGLHLGTVGKSELLKRVVLEGPLPRKTFSMGEAHEKRFYIEARRIR